MPFTQTGAAVLADQWWEAFKDPLLDSLVESGLSENLELGADWSAFAAALATVARERSFLFPQVEGVAAVQTGGPQQEFAQQQEIQAGLRASYEIDLWGRIRAGIQAEEFRSRATYYDYQTAAMLLSAEIANAWFELLTARRQLDLARKQTRTNEDIMNLIRARFAGGQIRAVDILRQEQLLKATRSQIILFETEIAILENRLAVLLGRPSQNPFRLPSAPLPSLPPLPDTGLPLDLVRRRPDVQRAYFEVLAADREMAQAIRSRYPTLALDVVGEVSAGDFSSLFENWAYSLGAGLVAPLFYGGRLRAEVDRTEAVKNQLLYVYGQSVLTAFEEVENALVRERQQLALLELLQERIQVATKTTEQLQTEFLNGMSAYLDVLLALDEQQQLQRDLLEAKQELLEIRIGLYRALGGDLETGYEPNNNAS